MFGPLFIKELLELSRRRRYFILRTTISVVLLLAVILQMSQLTGRLTPALASRVGANLFQTWSIFVVLGIGLVVPAFVSGLIAGERDSGTLDVLFTTCLNDREILIGKLCSRLLVTFTLILSSLPVLALASFYGGFDVLDVGIATLIQVLAAVFTASIGLYYSTVSQKPYIAMIRTYFLIGVIWYVIPWLIMTLSRSYVSGFDFLSQISSSIAIRLISQNRLRLMQSFDLITLSKGLGLHVFFQCTMAAVYFRRSERMLRSYRPPTSEPWPTRLARRAYYGLVFGARAFVERQQHWPVFNQLWAAERWTETLAARRRSLGEAGNPLLLRNSTANVYDPGRFLLTAQLLVWTFFIALSLYSGSYRGSLLSENDFHRILLYLGSCAVILFSLVLAASTFARERTTGSWEVLMLTEVTPAEFALAITAGVARTLLPLVVFIFVTSVLAGYVLLRMETLVVLLFDVGMTAFYVVIMSMMLSLFSRTAGQAIALALASLAATQLVAEVTTMALGWNFSGRSPPGAYTEVGSAVALRYGMAIIPLVILIITLVRSNAPLLKFRLWLATVIIPSTIAFAIDTAICFVFTDLRFTNARWFLMTRTMNPMFRHLFARFYRVHWSLGLSMGLSAVVLLCVFLFHFDRLAGRSVSRRKSDGDLTTRIG